MLGLEALQNQHEKNDIAFVLSIVRSMFHGASRGEACVLADICASSCDARIRRRADIAAVSLQARTRADLVDVQLPCKALRVTKKCALLTLEEAVPT